MITIDRRSRPSRRRTAIAVALGAVITVALAACNGGPDSSAASASASASAAAVETPSAAPTSAAPTASASASASASAINEAPTATPVPTPCPVKAARFAPPSDRLLTVSAATAGDQDLLTFHFGNMSIETPGGPPKGEFSRAKPPYTEGPSGRPIDMQGQRVLQVVFRGMSLQSDTGEIVFQGPPELQPDLTALKHAVEYDESEGVIGWYVGYDGPGCVTISRDGKDVVLAFDHAG